MMRMTLLLVLLMVWCQTSWAGAMFSVDTEKNKIIDQFGRERIFHGENVIMKTIPFVPITTHFDARHTETQSNHITVLYLYVGTPLWMRMPSCWPAWGTTPSDWGCSGLGWSQWRGSTT